MRPRGLGAGRMLCARDQVLLSCLAYINLLQRVFRETSQSCTVSRRHMPHPSWLDAAARAPSCRIVQV